jgi:hypothetical protein
VGLFKSSPERRLNKLERVYWDEFENMRGVLQSLGHADLDEQNLKRIHNTAFARAVGELFGLQAHQHPSELDPLKEDLLSRAQRKYLN